jgi:6,7-dimethyl-8-ribityllumazine synthase
MFSACIATLKEHEVPDNQVIVTRVPGSYELTSAAQMLLESNELDAVICLGCIIKGETPHDEHIASAVANGITRVSIDYSTPVIFGVLTTLNQEQAEARSGGKKGNKGVESAITALKMAALRKQLI